MFSAHVLCQEERSAANVPVTGSPEVVTVTWASLPSGELTVIPFDGSALLSPLPGPIATVGPAGDGLAEGETPAPVAELPGDWVPDRWITVVVLPVHPVTVRASAAPAAKAEIPARIALMSAPFPPSQHAEHRHFRTKSIQRDVPAKPILLYSLLKRGRARVGCPRGLFVVPIAPPFRRGYQVGLALGVAERDTVKHSKAAEQ